MKIADVKDNIIITDGGINAAGWEFGQHFYFPIINLTHPNLKEKNFRIYGSLCTPRDFWGYYIFAKKNEVSDIIAIPNYGAYKFTLAQEFIRPIPGTYTLRKNSVSNPKNRGHKRIEAAGLDAEIEKSLHIVPERLA
jgi:diaminopimelate decarboxylase